MQVLEKILEEIKVHRNFASECGNFNVASAFELCVEIIRKHMNDGWISVEDRLPEDTDEDYYQSVIVTLLDGRVAPGVYREQDEEWWVEDEEGIKEYTFNQDVIAWCPMPEPYRPERSDGK